MHCSFLVQVLAAAAVARANQGPPQPQQAVGPHVLAACKCGPVVEMIAKCQQETSPAGAEACACGRGSAWIGASSGCRDCLLAARGIDLGSPSDFYTNFMQTVVNVYTVCEAGIAPRANGTALCATANSVDACTAVSQYAASADVSRAGVYGTGHALCTVCRAPAPHVANATAAAPPTLATPPVRANSTAPSGNRTVSTPSAPSATLKSSAQRLLAVQAVAALVLVAAVV